MYVIVQLCINYMNVLKYLYNYYSTKFSIPNYTTVAEKIPINYNQLQLPITIKTGRQWTNAPVLYYRGWGLRVRVTSVGGNPFLSESAAEGKNHNMYIRMLALKSSLKRVNTSLLHIHILGLIHQLTQYFQHYYTCALSYKY